MKYFVINRETQEITRFDEDIKVEAFLAGREVSDYDIYKSKKFNFNNFKNYAVDIDEILKSEEYKERAKKIVSECAHDSFTRDKVDLVRVYYKWNYSDGKPQDHATAELINGFRLKLSALYSDEAADDFIREEKVKQFKEQKEAENREYELFLKLKKKYEV